MYKYIQKHAHMVDDVCVCTCCLFEIHLSHRPCMLADCCVEIDRFITIGFLGLVVIMYSTKIHSNVETRETKTIYRHLTTIAHTHSHTPHLTHIYDQLTIVHAERAVLRCIGGCGIMCMCVIVWLGCYRSACLHPSNTQACCFIEH